MHDDDLSPAGGPEPRRGPPPDPPSPARRRTLGDVLGGADGDEAPDPAGPAPTLLERFRASPVVWTVALVDVLLLVAVEATGGTTTPNMIRWGAQTADLAPGEWWRMVTSVFLHFGLLHLAFNLWALAVFGPMLERLIGHLRFAALLLASGLAGSAASALFVTGAVSAGTSGAIFGLLGAFGVVGFRLRDTPGGQAVLRQAGVLVGLNVLLGLSSPSIGLEAHLGGLVGGVVVMLAQSAGRSTHRDVVREDGALVRVQVPPPLRRWSGLVAAATVGTAALLAPFTLA